MKRVAADLLSARPLLSRRVEYTASGGPRPKRKGMVLNVPQVSRPSRSHLT